MNTAGCTTGWVNYANEPSQAALERASQDAYDVITLTHSKAAARTVDDALIDQILKKNFYLFIVTLGGVWSEQRQKLDLLQNTTLFI